MSERASERETECVRYGQAPSSCASERRGRGCEFTHFFCHLLAEACVLCDDVFNFGLQFGADWQRWGVRVWLGVAHRGWFFGLEMGWSVKIFAASECQPAGGIDRPVIEERCRIDRCSVRSDSQTRMREKRFRPRRSSPIKELPRVSRSVWTQEPTYGLFTRRRLVSMVSTNAGGWGGAGDGVVGHLPKLKALSALVEVRPDDGSTAAYTCAYTPTFD